MFYPLTALIAVLSLTTLSAETSEWKNPIVPDRADPHIFLHADGYYYMTASVPEYDRIEIRRARTIAGLADGEAKVIWRKHPTGPMSYHIWAPELHWLDGKWYVYVSSGEVSRKWNIRLYVLENASADPFQGDWLERGQFQTNWDSFTLDATVFEHRGTRYLVWAQSEIAREGTNIYIARMDTPLSIAGKQVMLATATHPWELRQFRVQEGPAALIRNGKVFLTYSANSTDYKYCMGLLTADAEADLLAPQSWSKSPEPVLDSEPEEGVWGPGHNSFTTTPDRRTDLLVFHARNYKYDGNDPLHTGDRATLVRPIRWTTDGYPDFNARNAQ